jgi:tetratricopeptide (TPR) repeat protein
MKNRVLLLATLSSTFVISLLGKAICLQSGEREQVGHIIKIRGPVYWKQSAKAKEMLLDPERDRNRALYVGEMLLCGEGGFLRVILNRQERTIEPSEKWVEISLIPKQDHSEETREGSRKAEEDEARAHYNTGVELTRATPPDYQSALREFEQATAVDPSKHPAMAELSHKANANLAEIHYQIGVDMFNKKDRAGAKTHFEAAVAAVNKAIITASPVTNDPNNDLLIYYNILAKNAQLLVEYYGATNLVDDTVKALDKAASLDAANKYKWGVVKADMYRAAGRTDDAVVAYKAVIAADPNNADALYGLGLTLITSNDRAQIQEGVDTLALFASKAPATDKRVPIVKETLESAKNAYKIEAEKPSSKARRKP